MWFVWFVSFVWLNQTNQMNETNQINQFTRPACFACCGQRYVRAAQNMDVLFKLPT